MPLFVLPGQVPIIKGDEKEEVLNNATNSGSSPKTTPFQNALYSFVNSMVKAATFTDQYQFNDAPVKIPDELPSINGSAGTSSAEDVGSSSLVNELKTYLDGLFTNQGKENQLNREYNSAQAALNREFQSAEAQLQRDWYTQMSNTAYQRSVADLKAAGLNPALAYSQGGAASAGTGIPSGSAAAYTATGGDTISSILSSVADVITSLSGASASKVSSAFKIFKMFGG